MKIEFDSNFEVHLVSLLPTVFWLVLILAELLDASAAIRRAAAAVSALSFVVIVVYGRIVAKRNREGRAP